ncbi:DUF726-domain-containing protein [Testicularia cyperi]|uniref:DUF726-domain-containing protein n=1 Tax=Testicularia cyperi TaxID=1882483 RepID=A0A317XSR2_9BASI|nr:DUF726-domain-containing protein [Testicularia cyperi]
MFSKKAAPNQPSLDLSALQSYSPKWSPDLRLATCIAVKYAVARHVQRISALAGSDSIASTTSADRGPSDASDAEGGVGTPQQAAQAWHDYGQKFLTATCQHLGVPEKSLPPSPIGLEDVLNAAQGRIEDHSDDGKDTEKALSPSNYEPEFESGSDHMRRFPNLDLPIKGVDDKESKSNDKPPPAYQPRQPKKQSDERQRELQEAFADLELRKGSPSSLDDGDDLDKFNYDDDAHELPEYFRSGDTFSDAKASDQADQDRQKRCDAASFNAASEQIRQDAPEPVPQPRRIQGVIDAESGQEIEIAHELLLIALGLGQFRAQDGSTTLFEQDMLFGETELDLPSNPTSSSVDQKQPPELPPRPQTVGHSDSAASLQAQPEANPDAKFSNDALNTMAGASRIMADASMSAFSSLKTGTLTGWGKLSSASKELVGAQGQGATRSAAADTPGSAGAADDRSTDKHSQPKKPQPVKPNEICHYDARARSLIFVAVTAMGVEGRQVWMAEKVMAQTIYFIMSEGDKASATKDGKGRGLIERLPLGASLNTRTGSVKSASSQRSEYMNQHSDSVVQRERDKVTWGKWAAMGGGFLAGGLVIGLTGGLAAPLIAPALVGLTGASFLATSGGIIMLGTLFGLGGGGLAGYKVERRLRGVSSFSFAELQTEARKAGIGIPSLHATVCCSGLILQETEQVSVWSEIFATATDGRDAFAVQCEAEMMRTAGQGLRSYMLDNLIRTGGTRAAEEVVKKTALAGIAAITLPMTVFNAASATLDGVFVRAKTKAHKAGLILAETLKNEVQGHRPVVLIGTSLGAATIVSALSELSKDPEANGHLIDSVFLISAPIIPSASVMRQCRSVVQRRFVNVFSSNDMVCSIAAWLGSGIPVEQLRQGSMPRVAGSKPINSIPGVENINVSDILASHFDVNDPAKLRLVLARCGALDD